jgi:hypothetical protein
VTSGLKIVTLTSFAMRGEQGKDPGGRIRQVPLQTDQHPGAARSGETWLGAGMNQNAGRFFAWMPKFNISLLRLLSPQGYDVVSAVNGWKLWRVRGADLTCLLDVMMPGMDGFEVCRRINPTIFIETSRW